MDYLLQDSGICMYVFLICLFQIQGKCHAMPILILNLNIQVQKGPLSFRRVYLIGSIYMPSTAPMLITQKKQKKKEKYDGIFNNFTWFSSNSHFYLFIFKDALIQSFQTGFVSSRTMITKHSTSESDLTESRVHVSDIFHRDSGRCST